MIDDGRGQLDGGGWPRLVVTSVICLIVTGMVLYEVYMAQLDALDGQEITETGGPWMDPGMAAGLLVLGAIVLGANVVVSKLSNRGSAKGDRGSAKGGDRS